MRTKKPSVLPAPSALLKLTGHTVMGVAVGLIFALSPTLIDQSGVLTLIDQCRSRNHHAGFRGHSCPDLQYRSNLDGA